MAKGSRKVSEEENQNHPELEKNSAESSAEAHDVEIDEEPAAEEAISVQEETDPVQKLEQELQVLKDDYLRLAAEFDNYKKRTNREFAGLIKTANENLIIGLLEFIDNFSRALENGEEKPEAEGYHKGLKLVHDQLFEILGRHGLAAFESVGEKFDPNLHEALMTVQSDEYDPDYVAQEFVKGYKLDDKVIRHAKVGVVGSKTEEE